MKIGIISDTHGKLHPPVLELTASCDVVLHAGDVDNSQTLDQLWMHLKPNAPFYLVRGNNDRGWAERIAKTQRFCQAGVSFFMVHDRKDVSWDLDGVQVVVFGHSHKFTVEEIDGRLWLNPGSCGRPRFGAPLTLAVLTIEDGVENQEWMVEKITISNRYVENTTKTEVREKIQELLKTLKAEQEKKPLRLVEQLGYLMYVRLFIESQKRVSLQESFPFAGFPMEWIPGEEEVEDGQRSWQLQYQVQYCSSMVEQGHFMETARLEENSLWMKELCKLIDWTADHCDWEEGMPHLFGALLEEMLRQMYAWGTTGLFLMPENLTEALIRLADGRNIEKVWNPATRTGGFLAAAHRQYPQWQLYGCEEEKSQWQIARMLQFYHGGGMEGIRREDPLEADRIDKTGERTPEGEVPTYEEYDLIVTNPPVGELPIEDQDRYWISTRKAQLQYMQMLMNHVKKQGMVIAVVNEGTLFMYDAEQKVRQYLLNDYQIQGVISLPAGAFLPYTGSKASVLIFTREEEIDKEQPVWFYEIQNLGYSLDRRQESTGVDDIPAMLTSWENRKELADQWKHQLKEAAAHNQWENPVPAHWEEKSCWFASLDTIAKNDNNLSAGRYKPWKEQETVVTESPAQLLKELADLETDTMKKVQELMEMAGDYE